MREANVTKMSPLCMQLCIPWDWTDQMILEFAESKLPCMEGLEWEIRTDPKYLEDDPIRAACEDDCEMVHVVVDSSRDEVEAQLAKIEAGDPDPEFAARVAMQALKYTFALMAKIAEGSDERSEAT